MTRRIVKTVGDIPENAVYYSSEYERHGNRHDEWTRLYNANFEAIEDVDVYYSNTLDALKEIVSAKESGGIAYLAYTLTKLNDDFYLVEKNKDTSLAIESMAKTLAKDNGLI